ncbi:MAG: hypothetical protein KDE00_12490, partial [Rhodobacteraceae bacterium]|nr:hypothetical protein [Paracoccaceae bacterium]
ISQGHTALRQLGWGGESPLSERNAKWQAAQGTGVAGEAPPDTAEIEADHTVDGSRSTVYALIAGTLARLQALEGLVLLNVVIVFAAVWLAMRVAMRRWGLPVPLSQAIAMPIIAACFGSLPFFVAYLMPDTFAPVLLLVVATLTVFGRYMTPLEIVFAIVLGTFAVVAHLSHLAIGLLLIPVSAVVSIALDRHRWWLAPAMFAIIVGMGFAEQSMLRTAAKSVSGSEVVIKPYITARLIQDGPGLKYLETHCPDAAIASCKLYEALQWSDDPYRITATHIVFETSPRLGSFRLMTPEDQRAVADDQIPFFFEVLKDQPVATVMAFAKNMFIQSGWIGVDLTLTTDKILAEHEGVTGLGLSSFSHGRLTQDRGWYQPVTIWHGTLYLVSLSVILGLILLPRRVPGEVKAFALMVLFGLLVNALVCGGISQPSTRYGARVVWLLPMIAVFMMMFAVRDRQFATTAEGRA